MVVSSDASRPIRQQRALYETVLQLEKEGACVVERPLSLIDAVLSPSAALIIYDNTTPALVRKQCSWTELLSSRRSRSCNA